jgi:DUF1365 family protein
MKAECVAILQLERESNMTKPLSKTEARQGRVVKDGRIAKLLMMSMVGVAIIAIALFLFY